MKNSEIRALNEAELKQKIASEEEALQKIKFAHAITPIENPMKIKQSRRLVARLKTAMSAMVLENNKG